MISDVDVKIADNPEEAFWIGLRDRALKDIETHHREIIINGAIIELAHKKIDEVNKKHGHQIRTQ